MTQTASISSIDKKKFLKTAFKGFCASNGKRTEEAEASLSQPRKKDQPRS
ncbi:hypothetical protein [Maridesulfovibrio sp.]|nr:hypothetical protein [Maridesulfovibrio sp.]